MSETGHERRLGGQAVTSGLPRTADVVTGCWQVSEGPQAEVGSLFDNFIGVG